MLSLQENQIIAGRYRLTRALARGGMGSVWVARHLQLDLDVAVKFMAAEYVASSDARSRFEREAKASAQLKSPNVVQVHDYGVEDDTPFIVMELLDGEDLEARLAREGRLGAAATAAILVPVCRALRRAHDAGLVHRDLKPSNIFLARSADEETPKVLDFGIAKVQGAAQVGSSTKTGALLGSPHYMSPEQVRKSRAVDHRSDLWSMGVIVFRCLTGELPFPGDEIGDVLVGICSEPVPLASGLAPDLGPEVDRFFERALAREMDRRFQSARELAEALALLAPEGERVSFLAGPASAVASGAQTSREAASSGAAATLGEAPTLLQAGAASSGRASAPSSSDAAATVPTPPPASASPASETVSSVARTLASAADAPGDRAPEPRGEVKVVLPPDPPRTSRGVLVALLAVLVVAVALGVESNLWRDRAANGPVPLGATSPPAAGARCSTNRACVAQLGGKPALCRKEDGACVALAPEGCRVLADPPDIESDATLWLGAMFPAGASDPQSFGPRAANAVDLARRDFAKTTGGLPPARPGGPKRPIGVVLCDDTADPARVAAHLADDVRVPAILGFARSKEVLDLAPTLFAQRGVLALAANMASSLRDIPRAPGGQRLVWRMTTGVDAVVPAVAAMLAEVVEPELRAGPDAIPAGKPVRVTLVRADNTSGQSYADAFVSALRFNGKSVGENGDDFQQIVVTGAPPASVEHAADQIVAGGAPRGGGGARGGGGGPPRPRWITDAPLLQQPLLELAGSRPDVRSRVLGVGTSSSTAVLAKLVMHYNEVFSPKVTPEDAPGAPYDGVYLLAYAAAALGDQSITGPALAHAIARLQPPGERIDVGPGGIYTAFYALQGGKNIDLDGASTSLDFDAQTGDAAADLAAFCLAPGASGAPAREVESGLFFRARSRKLEGTRRCP